ncbi:MAG: hypothetical protein IJ390_06150 [Lachnospiraceae bacterium]|nr:hypothetical protein [Lachnospiraceae bacterium]
MKEKLYTIPLNDAVNANDECPFCFIERNVEQDLLDFALGSCASYMESDVREDTDKAGFCRAHMKKMFDYGNTLGNGWILKTYYKRLLKEMEGEFKQFKPGKTSMMDRFKKTVQNNAIGQWVVEKESTCYICDRFKKDYDRYIDTFFYLMKNDPAFVEKIKNGKGFCLHHFGDICSGADTRVADKEKEAFYELIFDVMLKNMQRMSEDVDWLVEKFDYRYKDADWKNSKDAVQRGMQKIRGGYPADPVYKMNK